MSDKCQYKKIVIKRCRQRGKAAGSTCQTIRCGKCRPIWAWHNKEMNLIARVLNEDEVEHTHVISLSLPQPSTPRIAPSWALQTATGLLISKLQLTIHPSESPLTRRELDLIKAIACTWAACPRRIYIGSAGGRDMSSYLFHQGLHYRSTQCVALALISFP